MTTIREQILQALEAQTGASRGLDSYDGTDLPFLAMFEGPDAYEHTHSHTTAMMTVRLEDVREGHGEDKRLWWQQGNQILGDLIQSSTTLTESLADLCRHVTLSTGNVAMPADGSKIVTAYIDLQITYRFRRGNPFEQ